jgi:hypothetical protein
MLGPLVKIQPTTWIFMYFSLLRVPPNQHHITYSVMISSLDTFQAAKTTEKVLRVK